MNYDTFLVLLMAVSVLTSLVTEAVKNWLTARDKTYSANAIAGATSVILAVAVGGAYAALEGGITGQLIIMLVALVLLSWLCAMVGYDKVVQAIQQIKNAATGSVLTLETITDDETISDAETTIANALISAATTEGQLELYTKTELKTYMDSVGITYTARATKAELIAAILAAEKEE